MFLLFDFGDWNQIGISFLFPSDFDGNQYSDGQKIPGHHETGGMCLFPIGRKPPWYCRVRWGPVRFPQPQKPSSVGLCKKESLEEWVSLSGPFPFSHPLEFRRSVQILFLSSWLLPLSGLLSMLSWFLSIIPLGGTPPLLEFLYPQADIRIPTNKQDSKVQKILMDLITFSNIPGNFLYKECAKAINSFLRGESGN